VLWNNKGIFLAASYIKDKCWYIVVVISALKNRNYMQNQPMCWGWSEESAKPWLPLAKWFQPLSPVARPCGTPLHLRPGHWRSTRMQNCTRHILSASQRHSRASVPDVSKQDKHETAGPGTQIVSGEVLTMTLATSSLRTLRLSHGRMVFLSLQ